MSKLAALIITLATIVPVTVSASPFGTMKSGIHAGEVVQVANGCGRFRHWSYRLGRCVLN